MRVFCCDIFTNYYDLFLLLQYQWLKPHITEREAALHHLVLLYLRCGEYVAVVHAAAVAHGSVLVDVLAAVAGYLLTEPFARGNLSDLVLPRLACRSPAAEYFYLALLLIEVAAV